MSLVNNHYVPKPPVTSKPAPPPPPPKDEEEKTDVIQSNNADEISSQEEQTVSGADIVASMNKATVRKHHKPPKPPVAPPPAPPAPPIEDDGVNIEKTNTVPEESLTPEEQIKQALNDFQNGNMTVADFISAMSKLDIEVWVSLYSDNYANAFTDPDVKNDYMVSFDYNGENYSARCETSFANSDMNGKYEYISSGVKIEMEYKNGKIISNQSTRSNGKTSRCEYEYYENGNIKSEVRKDYDGTITVILRHEDGSMEDETMTFPDGLTKHLIFDENGKKIGEEYYYA